MEPTHLPSPSPAPPVPAAGPSVLDNMVKEALESCRTAAEQNRSYYGRVMVRTDTLHVYVASSCVTAGKPNIRAGSGVYWGPNSRWNKSSSVLGKQSDGRAGLFAVTLALLSAPMDRTLVIFSSSQFVIRTFCYWAGSNYTEGWPCKNADIIKVTAELMRKRPAGVIFRYSPSPATNNHSRGALDLARKAAGNPMTPAASIPDLGEIDEVQTDVNVNEGDAKVRRHRPRWCLCE
ncbi:hypothetical protein DFH07DRAFT_735521 [Mycena maculata]|uniref:ribonuclease H n=1 Tax=Mycena maculata TaxID=230809 RepID=A0AAD7JTI3_9AGAR|nr:hypothetical protein DFH07DRAFT_735521 [Mycena maculata]